MTLSEELKARGFVHQHTGESLEEVLEGTRRTVYHGIDPSAESAHAGNMVIWMLLRHLTNAGHKVIFLVGGGTGMIGDPKPDAERTLTDATVVDTNVVMIKSQAERLIGGEHSIEFVNNADWLLQQNLVTFLRDIGKHFTVNELIKKDAIATRLTSDVGLSYTEFAYPLLQGFDYLTLYKTRGCDLQVGGSDQWGNIISGVDLIRRKERQFVHALTVPLVVDKVTGKKFGKSEGNAVWLDAAKTSPYKFYQFWFNVSDESVVEYLKLFTFISLEDITSIETEFLTNPGSRSAQKRLAREVTTFVHGAETATAVEKVSGLLFGGEVMSSLTEAEINILKRNAPNIVVVVGMLLVDVLVQSKLSTSKREARTFIESGAVELSGTKVVNADTVLSTEQFTNRLAILKRGKKQLCILMLE